MRDDVVALRFALEVAQVVHEVARVGGTRPEQRPGYGEDEERGTKLLPLAEHLGSPTLTVLKASHLVEHHHAHTCIATQEGGSSARATGAGAHLI